MVTSVHKPTFPESLRAENIYLHCQVLAFYICGLLWMICTELVLKYLLFGDNVTVLILAWQHLIDCFAVVQQLLRYQSATLGLFPLRTSNQCRESHVRDNIYCAISVWGLSLAYRYVHLLLIVGFCCWGLCQPFTLNQLVNFCIILRFLVKLLNLVITIMQDSARCNPGCTRKEKILLPWLFVRNFWWKIVAELGINFLMEKYLWAAPLDFLNFRLFLVFKFCYSLRKDPRCASHLLGPHCFSKLSCWMKSMYVDYDGNKSSVNFRNEIKRNHTEFAPEFSQFPSISSM